MTEIPKRLKPKPETLRELFLKSGKRLIPLNPV